MTDKVIITGSGRCGTTYLVELLTTLGLDTGYSDQKIQELKQQYAQVVLEWPIYLGADSSMPYIIKSPLASDDLLGAARYWDWNLRHVYVCIRNWDDVAQHLYDFEYRSNVVDPHNYLQWPEYLKEKAGLSKEGALDYLKTRAASMIGNIMVQLERAEIPYTFLLFPKIVTDPGYLYRKLKYVLKDMPYETFLNGFTKKADTSQIHYGTV